MQTNAPSEVTTDHSKVAHGGKNVLRGNHLCPLIFQLSVITFIILKFWEHVYFMLILFLSFFFCQGDVIGDGLYNIATGYADFSASPSTGLAEGFVTINKVHGNVTFFFGIFKSIC
jgi:hypothetical protein